MSGAMLCSSTHREVLVDPNGDEAERIRRALTVKTFVPDEFNFTKSQGKETPVFRIRPDGFDVPRFWGQNTDVKPVRFPTWADPRLLELRPLIPGVIPKPLQITCKMQPGAQTDLRNAIVASWNECGGATLTRFCGGGKTEIAMAAWHHHRSHHLWGSHGKLGVMVGGLGDMWLARCRTRFPDAKVVFLSGESKPKQEEVDAADIVIISLHLAALGSKFSDTELDLDYVMVDEAHDIGGAKLMTSAQKIGFPRYLFAMSATPDRWDGMGRLIFWLFGPQMPVFHRPAPAYKIHTQLVRVNIPPSGVMPSFTVQRFGKSVFDRNRMFSHLHKSDRWLAAIIKAIMWHKEHVGPTIVFFRRLQTLKDIHRTLVDNLPEISCVTLFGETKKADRVLHNQVDIILANTSVGRQGHDWPWLRGVVFATGLSGKTVQDVGRGRRDHPDKRHLWVTYLCPTDAADATSRSGAHDKAIESATMQGEFYMRPRSEGDGLQADTLRCVDTDMKPVPDFVDMLRIKRMAAARHGAGEKRGCGGGGANMELLKTLQKRHKKNSNA